MFTKKYFLSLFFIIASICFCITNLFAQEYYPLEIGNRWDYFIEYHANGGIIWYDTLSIKIIDKQTLLNGKEYYVFSQAYPLWYSFYPTYYMREEDNKIYFYDEEDSIDCFAFRFDLEPDTFYYNCKGSEMHIIFVDTSGTFGFQDIHQEQDSYSFSKKFGITDYFLGGIVECKYELRGCIISGITYGQFLVSVENVKNDPISFKLKQNHPNPFNPNTSIQYSISSRQFVSLKVFNVLGKEIATLVSEEKAAGSYEIEFKSSVGNLQLASGIYYYQLRAGDYVETKKMILMK